MPASEAVAGRVTSNSTTAVLATVTSQATAAATAIDHAATT